MEPKRTRFLSHSLADRTALRPVLLLALLAFSLGLILWLSPAQASTIAASPLASPESLPAAKFTSDARAVINSPLGSQVNQLPFTPLTELPGEVNDFVTALGAVLESQSLSSIAPLPFFAFPLSDPQVGAAPPIITQPIRNT
ncbi:MAG TPA: hypothetical protein PL105_25805, partial [Caldilineaceae bacterium]|nr:hypothetical protein [Caldilineaceae bacterium]